MLVEYTKSPLAIGIAKPRFSWQVNLEGRNKTQSAYQILIASDASLLEPGKPDIWDSGRVESKKSVNIEYAGIPLVSNTDYFWTIRLWDEKGQVSNVYSIEKFGTALLSESDWKATWIGAGPETEPTFNPYSISQSDASSGLALTEDDFNTMKDGFKDFTPEIRSPQLRKTFDLKKTIKRARVFVCGLGLFELRLNGSKVGDDVLTTPRTDYRKKVYYSTYDITTELHNGENVFGIILGNGWYNGLKKFWHWQNPWFASPKTIVQAEVEFDDGSKQTIISDKTWEWDWSPIVSNCIYEGEDYDARLEQNGWDSANFDSNKWDKVNAVTEPGGKLVAIDHEPNKIMDSFQPVSFSEPKPGVYVYDMGKVMTGWVKIELKNSIENNTISIRYAELQHDDGMINPKSSGGARQAETYIMKASKSESYEPKFTYHGFRYVEITGFPGTAEIDTLEARYVYNGIEESGAFECGNDLINKIHACTLQSQRCNLQMGVPTDDTQRAERLGWCGDAWSYAEECFYNFDSAKFWTKWIADFYDQQHDSGLVGYICPLDGYGEDLVWSAAFIFIPWWHYVHYGDIRILENSYPYLKKYIDYLERVGEKDIPPLAPSEVDGVLFPKCEIENRYPSEADHGYLQRSRFGDHLAVNEGSSGMGKDHPRSMATAFYYHDTTTMIKIAEVLGHDEDVKKYTGLAEKIKHAYNDYFYNEELGYYDVGSQSAQALAISFDLVPEKFKGRVTGYLNSGVNFRQRRITSGYAGTKWVVDAVGKSGRNDILWTRAIATDYPSWGYMLKGDKTTITENWIGTASQCHTTLGAAIDEWFFWGLAGIQPDPSAPGYEKVSIKPYFPDDLPWVKASLKTTRGPVVSEWKRNNNEIHLKISIPCNSSATICIPVTKEIKESATGIEELKEIFNIQVNDDESIFEIGSGDYNFTFPLAKNIKVKET